MKKRNVLFLAVLSALMVSCNTTTSSTSSATNSSSPVSTSQESSTKESSTPISSPISSSSSEESSSSSSVEIQHLTAWPEELNKEIKDYLDDQEFPFVEIGLDVDGSYQEGKYYYRISGTGIEYEASLLTVYENVLKGEGYTTTSKGDNLRMDKASAGISVRISHTNTAINLDIMYFKPYDKTNFTSYDNVEDYTSLLEASSFNDVPNIYLGDSITTSTISGKYYVTGGRSSSTFIDDVKASFESFNDAQESEDNKWTVTSENNTEWGKYILAKKTNLLGDQFEIRVYENKIGTDFDTKDICLCTMELTCIKAVEPTSWSTSITEDFKNEFDDKVIPFIFIGKVNDENNFTYVKESDSNINYYRLTGLGLTLNSTLISGYETTLNNEGYTTLSKTTSSLITKNTNTGFTLRISSTKSETIYLDIQYYEPYNKTGVTNYGNDEFLEMVDTTNMPFIYLGTKNIKITNLDWNTGSCTFKGGISSTTFYSDAKASIDSYNATQTEESAKWTYQEKTSDTLGNYIEAKSSSTTLEIYEKTDGKDFQSNDIKTCMMNIVIADDSGDDEDGTDDWSNSIKAIFTADLDGHTLPFINIGDKTATGEYYDDILSIDWGEGWDDSYLQIFKNAFDNDTNRTDVTSSTTWTTSIDTENQRVKASITFSDGCSISLSCGKFNIGWDDEIYGAGIQGTFTEHE